MEAAGTAQSNLQDGLDAARAVLSGLQSELGQLLDDNDPRWLAFGFDQPGHTGTPDVPQNLTVTPGAAGSHTLFVHCDDARPWFDRWHLSRDGFAHVVRALR